MCPLPPHLLFGDQLALCSDVTYHLFHQTVDHILIQDSVPPPSLELLLILLHSLYSPHISSMDLSQLGMIRFSKHRGIALPLVCISNSALLLFGQAHICPQRWKVRAREEAGHSGLLLLLFFRVSRNILCGCGRITTTQICFISMESGNLCILCMKLNVVMFGYPQLSAIQQSWDLLLVQIEWAAS